MTDDARCRYFVDHLVDELPPDGRGLDAAHTEHLAACGHCAERWQAAVRHAELLAALAPPTSPPELAEPEFLAGIYQRVAERGHEAIGRSELAAALVPIRLPVEVDWTPRVLDAIETGPLADSIGDLPQPPVPGWLWARVRGDIAAPAARRPARTMRRAVRVAGLAAALAISAALVLHLAGRTGREGNSSPAAVVLVPVDSPLHAGYSASAILRGG